MNLVLEKTVENNFEIIISKPCLTNLGRGEGLRLEQLIKQSIGLVSRDLALT